MRERRVYSDTAGAARRRDKMQYAIELYFDGATEKKLFDLAQRIADENIKK